MRADGRGRDACAGNGGMMATTTKQRVRLGIFGYGLIAVAHAEAQSHLEGVELQGVCGPRAAGVAAFADRFGVPLATTDVNALLASADIDAILVDTPDEFHHDLTLRSLAAGKHVLCEKPLAPTVGECRSMVAASERAPVVAMVGFSNRRFPWVVAAKHLIDSGELGRVFHLQVQSLSASMLRPGAKQRWRSDPARAPLGVLGDLGSHTFDMLRYFFGEVTDVCGDVRSLSDPDVANDDCVVLFRADGDVHGACAFSRVSVADRHYGPGRRYVLISGDRAAFTFENGLARVTPIDGEPRELPTRVTAAAHESYLAGATEPTLRAFVEAVRGSGSATPTFYDGLRCAQVLDATMRSSQTRRWTAVDAPERAT